MLYLHGNHTNIFEQSLTLNISSDIVSKDCFLQDISFVSIIKAATYHSFIPNKIQPGAIPFSIVSISVLQFTKLESFQGQARTPATYVASTDADPSAAKSFQESVDSTTKSASFPGDKDPKSLSRKHARAAEIVCLQCESVSFSCTREIDDDERRSNRCQRALIR